MKLKWTTQQLKELGYVEINKGEWSKDPPRVVGLPATEPKQNPLLYNDKDFVGKIAFTINQSKRRIRQSTKPLLNKLEQEWFDRATKFRFSQSRIIPQSVKFRLANGVWLLPDFFVMIGGFDSQDATPRAIEIKGPQQLQDDAVVKLKVAAKEYPWIRWSMEWKQDGVWTEQLIYP